MRSGCIAGKSREERTGIAAAMQFRDSCDGKAAETFDSIPVKTIVDVG
jgi:hypothetical protein